MFARRMQSLKASDIRELLKLTSRPEVISFAGGLPAPELFPIAEVQQAVARVLAEAGPAALQYSTSEGHAPLRTRIADRMRATLGTSFTADDILVTTGSQQGLDLIGKLFLDDGDEVLCESPTYMGAITAWNAHRPRWVEVPTDCDGMDVAALDRLLDRCRRARFIYVVPNFQNPTGRTWSRRRRLQLAELAQRRGIPVVEDNPYGEVRFAGQALPSLAALAPAAPVLCLGTFSKVFSPGLRLAWVAARQPFYEKLVILKQGADLHTSTLNQMLLDAYLEMFGLDAALRRITAAYRERCLTMVRALEREMPAGVGFTRPQGGLFLWVELPAEIDARELLAVCLDRQVAFVPGGSFYPNGGHENTLRLNFSNMPPERIEEGVRRLAAAVRELLARPAVA